MSQNEKAAKAKRCGGEGQNLSTSAPQILSSLHTTFSQNQNFILLFPPSHQPSIGYTAKSLPISLPPQSGITSNTVSSLHQSGAPLLSSIANALWQESLAH